MGHIWRVLRPVRSRNGGHDASPTEKTLRSPRSEHLSSHAPIRAKRSAPYSRALPLSQNETIRPRDRARSRPLRQGPLNRETLSDRPTPLTSPQRTTTHPEHTVERSKHDSHTSPEDGDARVDDEPFHHEAHGTSASVTTTRKPALRSYTARVIERAGERNTVAKTHFLSQTFQVGGGDILSTFVMLSHTTSIPFSSNALPTSSIFS